MVNGITLFTRGHKWIIYFGETPKLRDTASGGYLWGQSRVFLVLVTPTISRPVGVVFSRPALELRAW